jgi:hypothetical protein
LKYIPHHLRTLCRGELDKEDKAGGHTFLPCLIIKCGHVAKVIVVGYPVEGYQTFYQKKKPKKVHPPHHTTLGPTTIRADLVNIGS